LPALPSPRWRNVTSCESRLRTITSSWPCTTRSWTATGRWRAGSPRRMAPGSAAPAPKPNGARKWLSDFRCPCPSSNLTIHAPGLALPAGVEKSAIERPRRVRYLRCAQLKRPLDAS